MQVTAAAPLVLTLIFVSTGSLFGHGGLYRGPAPTLPPPPSAPGSGTPGAPGAPKAGGPVTGIGGALTGSRKRIVTDYTNWTVWWKFNKHAYLDLRTRLALGADVTGLGREGVLSRDGSPRPSFEELLPEAIPTLLSMLAESDADIVDSAVLALAKVTPKEQSQDVIEGIRGVLSHDDLPVRQSAILSLGILGDSAATPTLQEILRDTSQGRKSLGLKGGVHQKERGLAALSLGLLSDPAAVETLQEMYEKGGASESELKSSVILSLGLFRQDRRPIVSLLNEELGNRKLAELVSAQIPIALSRLGEPSRSLVPVLLKLAKNRRTRNDVRRSCVIALGHLAEPGEVEVVEVLSDLARNASDKPTRHFAWISVGEIAGKASGEPERNAAFLKEVDRFLLKGLVRPKEKTDLPFAGTACALSVIGLPQDSPRRALVERKLFEVWEDTRNPIERASLAVSLGLSRSREKGADLLKRWERSSNRQEKSYLVEALGLMRYEVARERLREELVQERDPQYKVALATGLGLLGDQQAGLLLARQLSGAETLMETSAVAKALGSVGGRSAVVPLVRLARDRTRPGLARAFACVALGLLGEKTPLPWNARITIGSNYLSAFAVQVEAMDIL